MRSITFCTPGGTARRKSVSKARRSALRPFKSSCQPPSGAACQMPAAVNSDLSVDAFELLEVDAAFGDDRATAHLFEAIGEEHRLDGDRLLIRLKLDLNLSAPAGPACRSTWATKLTRPCGRRSVQTCCTLRLERLLEVFIERHVCRHGPPARATSPASVASASPSQVTLAAPWRSRPVKSGKGEMAVARGDAGRRSARAGTGTSRIGSHSRRA